MVLKKIFLSKRFNCISLINQNHVITKWRIFTSSRCHSSSYAHQGSSKSLVNWTMDDVLRQSTEKNPDRLAVVSCHQQIKKTYQQFHADVEKMAAGLLSLGLERGSRVGMWSTSNYQWVVTQFATAKAGMVLVTINPAYKSSEVEHSLKKVGINAVVIPEAFKTQNYYQILVDLIPELPKSKVGSLTSQKFPDLKTVIQIAETPEEGTLSFSQLMECGSKSHFDQLEKLRKHIQSDDFVNIQYTSGTTSFPKAVALSHHNIVNNALFIGDRMGFSQGPAAILCVCPPLFHCFGCVIGTLVGVLHEGTSVLPSPTFDSLAALTAIQEERCTSLYGTPTMFIDVLENPELPKFDLTSLRDGIMAGANCPAELLSGIIKKLNLKNICVGYGCTETSPIITLGKASDSFEQKTETVGTLLDHAEVKIVNPEGEIVPLKEKGELWCRGYMNFRGYLGDEKKTKEALLDTRWYRTGDQASMDSDGYVRIVGRIKDLVIRGGENISPREVEEFIFQHPQVVVASVVGVPDARLGEELCVWIKLKEGANVTAEDIRKFCKGKISHFKIPKHIHFVDDFPKTASGKIQKYKIRDEMAKILKGQ